MSNSGFDRVRRYRLFAPGDSEAAGAGCEVCEGLVVVLFAGKEDARGSVEQVESSLDSLESSEALGKQGRDSRGP